MAIGNTTIEAYERAIGDQALGQDSEGSVMRRILREMRAFIEPQELEILLFIFDRTYHFGKRMEYITTAHFLHGIGHEEMEYYVPPVRCSRATLFRALQRLTDNGIIIKQQKAGKQTAYGLNPLWDTDRARRTHKTVTQTRLTHETTPVSPMRLGSLTHETYNNKITKREIRTTAPQAASDLTRERTVMLTPKQRVEATIADAREKTVTARNARKKKGGALAYERMWQDAFVAAYPEDQFFRFTIAQQAILKKALERGVPDAQRQAFVEFVVTDFSRIIAEKFGWMRDRPALPNVPFVAKNIVLFYTVFQDKDDPNRKLRREMRSPIKPRPVATQDDETDELRKKLAKAEQKVRSLEHAATEIRVNKNVAKKAAVRKLVTHRRTKDEEFGSWD